MNFEFTGREQINNSYKTGSKSLMDIVILTVGIGNSINSQNRVISLIRGTWVLK